VTKNPIVIIGAGGHSKVLADTLLASGHEILGCVSKEAGSAGETIFFSLKLLGGDTDVLNRRPDQIVLVNGIGGIDVSVKRKEVFEFFKKKGYRFLSVIHPSAMIGREVHLEEGVQILAGVVVQTGCRIGKNTIINTKASVDHDCQIEDHVHIAPGATLCGHVWIRTSSHIGTGATIIQKINIGKKAMIAAGSVVVENVPEGARIRGVPAREYVLEGSASNSS